MLLEKHPGLRISKFAIGAEGAPLLVDAQTFLGYEVDGIELMRYAVPASFWKASGRVAHLTRQEPRMRVG